MAKSKGKAETETTKHAGGRPSKYDDIKNIFTEYNSFESEKEMSDYIELNIKEFCSEVFDDIYISHKREYSFGNTKRHGAVSRKGTPNIRVDFLISCINGNYLVECKNPKQVHTELTRGIGQLLMYETMLYEKEISARCVIVSTQCSDMVIKIIKAHKLQFDFVVFNKECSAVYYGEK
jgi:hypothetical protein